MTREEAEKMALKHYPDIDWENTQLRQGYMQCWEDMQQNKQTCGFCVEPSEKAKQKEALIKLTQMGISKTKKLGKWEYVKMN
jgi:hypothetical protein